MNALAWWMLAASAAAHAVPAGDGASPRSPLAGTWTLAAAERILPDGRTVEDYGPAPKGRLVVDARGRYSLQIFRSDRPRFASADKARGTPAEYEAAVMGQSTHYGTIEVDGTASILTFRLDGASFPNWEGTVQKRAYSQEDGELRYRVPPRPDGSVPVSVWRRMED